MKEVLDALNERYQARGLYEQFTAITEGETPERVGRPYVRVLGVSEEPGIQGLKRTNHGEYLTVVIQLDVVSAGTFEQLTGVDIPAVDDATRYAVMTIPGPNLFIKIMPEILNVYFEDKYHRAELRYEAWFSKPAAFARL